MNLYTPENITELAYNEIFVFGSNKEGRHLGGAAKTAEKLFGAINGQGEGLQGKSYAIPTMGTMSELKGAVDRFFEFAKNNRDKFFLLTKIGCGIAGKNEEEIKNLFDIDTPINIRLPKEWETRKYVAYEYVAYEHIPDRYFEPMTRIIRLSDGKVGGLLGNNAFLSQRGDCFVYGNSKMYGNSQMYDNSEMYGNSKMYGNSQMYDNSEMYGDSIMHGNSQMYDNSEMYGNSQMYDNSEMYGNSKMYGNSQMYDNSEMYGNSKMYGNSIMYGDSKMYGNSQMYDNSEMYGNSKMYDNSIMYDNAKVGETQRIIGQLSVDITNNQNLPQSLYAQTLHYPVKNKVYLFKRVYKTGKTGVFTSCHDKNFIYRVGKVAQVDNYEDSTESCAEGLHASHLKYWDDGDTTIAVEIEMKDIITIQDGKVRCKKLKVIEEVI